MSDRRYLHSYPRSRFTRFCQPSQELQQHLLLIDGQAVRDVLLQELDPVCAADSNEHETRGQFDLELELVGAADIARAPCRFDDAHGDGVALDGLDRDVRYGKRNRFGPVVELERIHPLSFPFADSPRPDAGPSPDLPHVNARFRHDPLSSNIRSSTRVDPRVGLRFSCFRIECRLDPFRLIVSFVLSFCGTI